jgi:5'(3')-deoxyribonucleotidase
MTRRLYLDLDGVMADFDGAFPAVFGLDHRDMADDDMWLKINGHPSFFRDLPPMEGAVEFFRKIEHLNPIILTACHKSSYATVASQKVEWVRQHLSPSVTVLPVQGGTSKPLFMHARGDILIDDYRRNTEAWDAAGGKAILHRDFSSTTMQLRAEIGHRLTRELDDESQIKDISAALAHYYEEARGFMSAGMDDVSIIGSRAFVRMAEEIHWSYQALKADHDEGVAEDDKLLAKIRDGRAASKSLIFTANQAQALLDAFGGSSCTYSVEHYAAGVLPPDEDETVSPAGLYAFDVEYPEEGTIYLGDQEEESEPRCEEDLDDLQAEQAKAVMPLIGNLLDQWATMPDDMRALAPALDEAIAAIDEAMDGTEVEA